MLQEKSILLVEDDRYIALALRIRLEADAFFVNSTSSCLEALEAARSHHPPYVVIDYNLPDGNGIDLMSQLFQLYEKDKPTCIIMTASKKPGLRADALAKGAADYFEKPFTSQRLIESLQAGDLPGVVGL